jgi:hypothetical protein
MHGTAQRTYVRIESCRYETRSGRHSKGASELPDARRFCGLCRSLMIEPVASHDAYSPNLKKSYSVVVASSAIIIPDGIEIEHVHFCLLYGKII